LPLLHHKIATNRLARAGAGEGARADRRRWDHKARLPLSHKVDLVKKTVWMGVDEFLEVHALHPGSAFEQGPSFREVLGKGLMPPHREVVLRLVNAAHGSAAEYPGERCAVEKQRVARCLDDLRAKRAPDLVALGLIQITPSRKLLDGGLGLGETD